MHWFPRTVYNIIRGGIKFYLKIFLEFKVWGKSNIPKNGAKIFCSNHFSSTDPFFVITLMKEPVHMVIGPGFSVPFFRKILKHGEQINASPSERKNVVNNAASYLEKGESIYIFPEGDLNSQGGLAKFYTGIAKIYLKKPVPIIPIAIISPMRYVKEKDYNIKTEEETFRTLTVLSGKYYANIGEPLDFSEYLNLADADTRKIEEEITDKIKKKIEELLLDIKLNKFWS